MLYVVRLWDGFDGEWMDVSEPMDMKSAVKLAGDKNEDRGGSLKGKREGSYNDIDYYAAFPVTTTMRFSEGRSLTRGFEDTVQLTDRELERRERFGDRAD